MDYLIRGKTPVDDRQLQQEAEAYGVILPDDLQQPAHYRLWAEHCPAVDLFMRCATQWRTAGEKVIGLDYGVVLQMASLYGTEDVHLALEDLQVMELHARGLINQRAR